MSAETNFSSSGDTATDDGGRARHGRLQGNMGVFHLLFMVLAFNAPLGIIASVVPLVIGYGSGLATPMVYIVFGSVIAVFAVGYTVMARLLPRAGAFYTFVTAGLGRPLGLAASFVAIIAYSFGLVGTLVYSGIYLEATLVRYHAPAVPWWLLAIAIAIAIAVLGYLRIDFSARVLVVLVVLEIAVVLAFDAVVVFSVGATGQLSAGSFDPALLLGGGVAAGLVFAITSFAGFEATAIFRDEVREPERTVPLATYLAVGVIVAFYCLVSWVLIQAGGADQAVAVIAADPTGAFMNNVTQYLGRVGGDIITVLLLTSILASIVAFHNVVSRYVFNLGVDGVLPSRVGVPHPRFGSPHRASIAVSTICLVVIVVVGFAAGDAAGSVFSILVAFSGYFLLLLLFLAAVGIACYLLRTRPEQVSVWHRGIAPIIAAVAMAGSLVLTTLNLELLVTSLFWVIAVVSLAILAVLIGVAVALVLKSRRPGVYEQIGTSI